MRQPPVPPVPSCGGGRTGPGRGRASVAGVAAVTALLVGVVGACGVGGVADGDPTGTDASGLTAGNDGSGRGARDGAGTPSAPPTQPDAALPTFAPGTAVGGYAPGFPRDLLGAPDDATVLASSVSDGAGKLTDVTLNLSTQRSVQEALDQLAGPLRDAGFSESETAAFSGLTAHTTFTREAKGDGPVETVLLGVLDDGDRRLVTVSGSVVR
ncbi:hypothetical protein [Isoptericola sp. BMS4]|uniref:hypothetical protein n=1 Tax=Isoptericola sp. BMS4 TaxID=2527875 RepID=UPI0014206C6C|nr:hypothetical protein [Isoptericola sp. BMS4]